MSKIVGSKKIDIPKIKKIIAAKKEEEGSKEKEILYKDNTSGITYYSDGSTSKIKKGESKDFVYKDISTGKKYYKGDTKLSTKKDKDHKVKKSQPKKYGFTSRAGGGTILSAKKKAEKAAIAKAKANRDATQTIKSAEKKYAAKSMFSKARDDAKTTPGKARPFKEAFDAATKDGKSKFLWKGKGYLTTKGKREDRFPVTTDKKKAAEPKKGVISKLNEKIKSFRKKTTGYSTQKEWEDAKAKRIIQKRITKMKERKNQGKNYSAKNLAELQEKIKNM